MDTRVLQPAPALTLLCFFFRLAIDIAIAVATRRIHSGTDPVHEFRSIRHEGLVGGPKRRRVELPPSHPGRGAAVGVLRHSAERGGARSFEASPAGGEREGQEGERRDVAAKNRLTCDVLIGSHLSSLLPEPYFDATKPGCWLGVGQHTAVGVANAFQCMCLGGGVLLEVRSSVIAESCQTHLVDH